MLRGRLNRCASLALYSFRHWIPLCCNWNYIGWLRGPANNRPRNTCPRAHNDLKASTDGELHVMVAWAAGCDILATGHFRIAIFHNPTITQIRRFAERKRQRNEQWVIHASLRLRTLVAAVAFGPSTRGRGLLGRPSVSVVRALLPSARTPPVTSNDASSLSWGCTRFDIQIGQLNKSSGSVRLYCNEAPAGRTSAAKGGNNGILVFLVTHVDFFLMECARSDPDCLNC